jgi:SOS-response transcriptional repressor LexA
MTNFDLILYVDTTQTSQRRVFPKRKARIIEAKSWELGTPENKKYYTIWEDDNYKIALGKPGKEAGEKYTGKTNPDDMRPTIFYKGEELKKAATFQDIVKDLEQVGKTHAYALELLGCLLFRSAFLLDHKKVNPDSNEEIYRYYPNEEVVKKISETVPIIYGVPVKVFLHYLDAIALNEDVKYDFLGYDLASKSVGGRNNMLTYVNLIAVISGKKALYTLTGPLLRSGVAAITQKAAIEALPHLSNKINETKKLLSPYSKEFIKVPLVGSAPCGLPLMNEENIEEYIEVEKSKIKKGVKYFILRAIGDSMNLAGINDADLVLCRFGEKPETGNNVVALLGGENVTIKYYDKKDGNRILLPKSSNPKHQPIVPKEGDEVQGIVQEVIQIEEL